jgi:hypothetical protein
VALAQQRSSGGDAATAVRSGDGVSPAAAVALAWQRIGGGDAGAWAVEATCHYWRHSMPSLNSM